MEKSTNTKKYCTGVESHLVVKEIDSKVYQDYDEYSVTCLKCGVSETQYNRRHSEAVLRCGATK